jgi:hypothetical protein
MDPAKIGTLIIEHHLTGTSVCTATSLKEDIPPNRRQLRTAPSSDPVGSWQLDQQDLSKEQWDQIKALVKTTPGLRNDIDRVTKWRFVYDSPGEQWRTDSQ